MIAADARSGPSRTAFGERDRRTQRPGLRVTNFRWITDAAFETPGPTAAWSPLVRPAPRRVLTSEVFRKDRFGMDSLAALEYRFRRCFDSLDAERLGIVGQFEPLGILTSSVRHSLDIRRLIRRTLDCLSRACRIRLFGHVAAVDFGEQFSDG